MAPSWERMLTKAFTIVDAVNRDGNILNGMTLGGGTALMLQIGHRDSRDIDFIAAPPVTDHKPLKRTIEGRELSLDAVPAIIASKVYYRGSHLKARDIFDIAAACEAGHREAIRETLAAMPKKSAVARTRVGELPAGKLAELMTPEEIQHGFRHLLDEAPAIASSVLTFQP